MSAPRGEARRQAMLDAALALVARGGPRAVTHRAVATEAGVPLAATTYYFTSRDDLVAQALMLCAERDVARLADRDLQDLLAEDLESEREELLASYELWLEAARNPALRPTARKVTDTYVEAARAMARDDVDAQLMVAALEGLTLEVLVGGLEAAEARTAFARLLAALGVTAGRRPR
ncbi:MAG TPA: TetR family transcriptional regulator [Capillimicrobium sp.]